MTDSEYSDALAVVKEVRSRENCRPQMGVPCLRSLCLSFLGLAETELEALMSPPCLDPGSSISMTHGL